MVRHACTSIRIIACRVSKPGMLYKGIHMICTVSPGELFWNDVVVYSFTGISTISCMTEMHDRDALH